MGLFGASQKQRDEFFEQFPTEESYYDTEYDFAKLLSFLQEASRSKGYYKDSPKGEALMDIFTSAGSPKINVPTDAGRKGWSYDLLEQWWDDQKKRRSHRGGRAHFIGEGPDWENQRLGWKKDWFGEGKGKMLTTHQRGEVNVPLFPMKEEWMDEETVSHWQETEPEYAEKNIKRDPNSFFPRWVHTPQMNDRIANNFIAELSHGIQEADLNQEEREHQDTQIWKQLFKYGDTKGDDRGTYGVQGTHEYEAHQDIQDSLNWLLDNPSYYDYQNIPGVSEIKQCQIDRRKEESG